MSDSEKDYLPSNLALTELVYEYRLKTILVLTGCILVIVVVLAYIAQFFFFQKQFIDIKDVVIIGGIGFSAVVKFYFGEVKAKAPRTTKPKS